MDILSDLTTAAPEVLLAGFGLVGLLFCAIVGERTAGLMRVLGAAALIAAAWFAFGQLSAADGTAFSGLYHTSPFAAFAKTVTYALAAVALLISGRFMRLSGADRYEFALLTVLATMGAGVMLSANDLMTLYLGIETMSLASYVLAAFLRNNTRSAEAGLKYFVLGALASGLLLYGASLIYGFAGSTRFGVIAQAPMSVGMVFGLVLLIVGLAFKASAAPMHVWTPDVYEGAPAPVVAYFATGPKIAAVVVLASMMYVTFGQHQDSWKAIISIIAALSMLVGSFGALLQSNLRRIMAYSSISNVGFALIGVAAGGEKGASAVLVYMTIYVIATIGVFAGFLTLRRNGQPLETISDLEGLSKNKPGIAIGILILIFSIAGIPPAAGFWGKWEVFRAGISADLLWLVLVGAVASVISLGYYLRIVWAMMMKPAAEPLDKSDWLEAGAVLASAVIVFPVLTITIQTLLRLAAGATPG